MMEHDPRIDPGQLRNVKFPGSSRRYEVKAVDQFLATLAERVVATNELVDELRRERDEARARAEEVVEATPERPELSELGDDEVARLLGDETASVLTAARRAAEEIRTKAEEAAARMIREATDEANEAVAQAGDRVVELTSEAERVRDEAVAAARADAERIRQEADRDSHRIVAEAHEIARTELASVEARTSEAKDEAARIVAEAREDGRGMVAEAKEVRGRILDDLQRRRDAARLQIEQLTAGRDKLLEVYELVRANLDEVTGHLRDAIPDPSSDGVPALDEDEREMADLAVGGLGSDEPETVGEAAENDDVGVDETGLDDAGLDDAGMDDTVAPVVDDTVAPGIEGPTDETGIEDHPLADDDAAIHTPEDAGDVAVVADEGDPSVEPEPEPGPGAAGADEPGDQPSGDPDVDGLFARLRAEREASVRKAHEVLESRGVIGERREDSADDLPDTDAASADADTADDTDDVEAAVGGDEALARVPAAFLAPADLLAGRDEAIAAQEKALARALKRHLADEQNEVLDALRRSGDASVDALFGPPADHLAGYRDLAAGPLAAVVVAGGHTEASIDDDHVISLATGLAETLVEPFRRRVERSIEQVDGDPDDLDERLRALYREWKAQHLGPALDDALLSAFAAGTLDGAPEGATVRWTIDPAQGPCPDAEDNALGGSVAAGTEFPTGDRCPQAHPGCRCLLVIDDA